MRQAGEGRVRLLRAPRALIGSHCSEGEAAEAQASCAEELATGQLIE